MKNLGGKWHAVSKERNTCHLEKGDGFLVSAVRGDGKMFHT